MLRRLMALMALMASMLAVPALAGEKDIEYRQNVYKALGAHMNSAAALVRNEVAQPAHLARHADNIAALSRLLPDLFAAETAQGETDALPAIWAQPVQFAERMSSFQAAAANFQQVANSDASAAQVGRAFLQMAQTCRNCHDDYRAR